MKPIALALLFTLLTLPAVALEDTPANRQREADRYLLASPPREMMASITEEMAKTMPSDQRAPFQSLLALVDIDAVTQVMRQAMIKNFSADELKALADFYGSPAGKSAMKNFSKYMVDVMPGLEVEVMKAMTKAQQKY
ncbi:MAG: DUF2059 domain-containing protein [Cyanobacteriota bacterium]|jgi:hypothetical protein